MPTIKNIYHANKKRIVPESMEKSIVIRQIGINQTIILYIIVEFNSF